MVFTGCEILHHPAIPRAGCSQLALLALGVLRGLDILIEVSSLCLAYASFRQEDDKFPFPTCRIIAEKHVRAAMLLIAGQFEIVRTRMFCCSDASKGSGQWRRG